MDDKDNGFWASYKGFGVLAAIVLAIWLGNFWAMPYLFPPNGNGLGASNAGTAGDMFGGITALFSGLAFAGLLTTLFMQRKELELQRKELRQTREVFSVQRFENTFFGLLNLLNGHVNSIEIPHYFTSSLHQGATKIGRDALVVMAESLPKFNAERNVSNSYDTTSGSYKTEIINTDVSEVINAYETMYDTYFEANLGPYFRLIYNILRHIENTDFSNEKNKEKRKEEDDRIRLNYSKILRAHLNSSEVKLLMFNCASVHGRGLKPWVEKNSLLKHITREEYRLNKLIVDTYEPIAFRFNERAVN